MCLINGVFGRKFEASKFQNVAKLAISRSSILKKKQEALYFQEKSDVIQLLTLHHHERALLRVHLLNKYDCMIETLAMIEEYCHLLIKRVQLLQINQECPNELKEAITSLIFASSRIGEFPELKKMRRIFASKFGKEMAARAIELRNNCGVNPKIIKKLSDTQPSLRSKYEELHHIATQNGISLHLENYPFAIAEDNANATPEPRRQEPSRPDMFNENEVRYESPREAPSYRDAAEAAEDAYESAYFAAAYARAAVQLSIVESAENDDDQDYRSDSGSHGSSRRHGPMYVMVMGHSHV